MGIDVPALKFLIVNRARIGVFGSTITIGHQGLHFFEELKEDASNFVRLSGVAPSLQHLCGDDPYGDTLLGNLGATTVSIMDNSAYEGANIIHDLNSPVTSELTGKFDTLFDGGSIEHIYNTSVVVQNYNRLLKIGGHCMIVTTCNSYLGHGFYQFSPEWAFRTFSKSNGFETIYCFVVPCDKKYDLIPVIDPKELRRRVELFTTHVPCYLMITARKIADYTFSDWPQQSDYVTQWVDRS